LECITSSKNNGGVEARNINVLNLNGDTHMKNANIRVVVTLTAIAVMSFPVLSAQAQDGSATYKAKCAMCHGADGSKITAHDLRAAAAQGM
jgi:cytochrome c